ncbi:hypothetical protein GCM10025858_08400 [Alicyclobacillus sacchari]|nr:hypothetical protein GCM10025858_08400 [Alicyclobacillus sacchari]
MENEQPVPLQSFWQQFFGPNFGYLLELYEEYKRDPNAVSAETREMFNRYGDPGQAVFASLQEREVFTAAAGQVCRRTSSHALQNTCAASVHTDTSLPTPIQCFLPSPPLS